MTNKEKYKKAFDTLASSEIISLEAENMMNKKQRKPFWAVAAAASLVFGTITVGAAYYSWHSGLTEALQINEEQQKTLEENGMTVFAASSCTEAGVTVSAPVSITDEYYTYLSFKVDGYEPEKDLEPGFEKIQVTVDGRDEFSWCGSFYKDEAGSLEYHMVLSNPMEKGYFVGKPIHVEFENLGSHGKAEYHPATYGTWTLDWTLGGTDTSKQFAMEEVLGDTECVVKDVQISPVSFYITCEFPRREISKEYRLDDGTIDTIIEAPQAPWVAGVKLKDGTVLRILNGGPGISGFADETSNTYVMANAFDRVINVDEVAGILFEHGSIDGSDAAETKEYLVTLR